jgi:hypothetical protein
VQALAPVWGQSALGIDYFLLDIWSSQPCGGIEFTMA